MNSSSGSTADIYCSEQSSFNWVNKKVCGMLLRYAVRLRYCVFCFCQSLTNLLCATTQGEHSTHLSSNTVSPLPFPSKINTEIQMTCPPCPPVLLCPQRLVSSQASLVHTELKMIVPLSHSDWNVITLIYSHIITSLSIHHHLLQVRPLRNN